MKKHTRTKSKQIIPTTSTIDNFSEKYFHLNKERKTLISSSSVKKSINLKS